MAGSTRIILAVLAFLGLVALFILMQREDTDPAIGVDTAPAGFEAQQGEPEVVEMPAGPAAGSSTPPVSSPRPVAPGAESRAGVRDDAAAQPAELAVDQPGLAPAPTSGTAMPGPGQNTAFSGPGAGVDPAMPVQEMISLPPSGPGPGPASDPSNVEAPEHSPVDSALAPEAGSAGTPMSGPELLPVTHPGPGGELPTQPAPSEGP